MKYTAVACLLGMHLALAFGAQPPTKQPIESLKVQIIEGQAAVHNLRERAARDILVQVNDQANEPVAEAAVELSLPRKGPGGTFAKGSGSVTATTDARGRAVIRGFRPNGLAGKFTIGVSASYGGKTAQATITQFNVLVEKASRKSSTGKVVAILAVIGAAAGGGAYVATHRSASPAPAAPPAPVPSIGITPGTGVAGPPR